MAIVPNVFVDHTFLIARFAEAETEPQNRLRQRCIDIVDTFQSRPFPPKFYSTNTEFSRSITNVFRETGSSLKTSLFINRTISSVDPRIHIQILTKKVFSRSISEYRMVDSPYYGAGFQFLGLSTIFFMTENKHFNIREMISFDDKFVQAAELIGISVYS